MFGTSSEMGTQIDGQICLSGNTEGLTKKLFESQQMIAITVKEHKRTHVNRKPGIQKEMLPELLKETEEYIINPGEACSECGAPLKTIAKELVRTEVECQLAKLIVKQVIRQVAKCTKCGTELS